MRRLFSLSLGFILVSGLMVALPVLGQDDGTPQETQEKATKRQRPPKPVFETESQLVSRIPAVASGLAAVEADPENVTAWRNLGIALSVNGAHEDAVRALRKATRLDRKNPGPHVDLGAAYLRQGKSGPAGSAFKHALSLEPLHALAHYNLGLVHQLEDDYEESLEEFERAILIDPNLADPRKNAGASNNPDLPYVNLRVYMKTTGSAPALFAHGTKADREFVSPVDTSRRHREKNKKPSPPEETEEDL